MSTGGKMVAGGGGIGLVIAIIYALLGGDPSAVLSPQSTRGGGQFVESPQEAERREFVAVVLADTEEVWNNEFKRLGKKYINPKLVLFADSVQGACGFADAAVGPFYCPEDQRIYIDLSFYDLLRSCFGASGDFAQAYVVAHEVGHHVQNLLGTMNQMRVQRENMSQSQYNRLSVRLELQADFYAGVWAHHARRMENIDEQDIREAIEAASAIGDDAIQEQSQGFVVPDAFTHGTSEQRVRWFMRGWQTGDIRQGNTFAARDL